MGATNTTTYYNLSQFVGTDKPAWLQDYNGDMLKIDTGINAAKVAADSAALDASAAQLDATTALGNITNTINPAITSLQTTIGNQGGAINTINSLIGNGTPTTTDQTIIGAINELHSDLGALLWTNPSPSAAMASGVDIVLSSSNYDYLEIVYKSSKDGVDTTCNFTDKGSDARLLNVVAGGAGAVVVTRSLTYVDGTHYTTTDSNNATGVTAFTVNNNNLIPVKIYGHKRG